jgi:hypothetical protein
MTSLFADVSLLHKNKAAAIMKIKTMKKRQRYKFIFDFFFFRNKSVKIMKTLKHKRDKHE